MKPLLGSGWLSRWSSYSSAVGFISSLILSAANTVDAQVVPDATLGAESSTIAAEVIRGGARRGQNLFHSFSQFDVLEGRSAYFENPTGVQNIFSRVTGSDRSEIFGRLGVLGNANLFLLNPSGILFGANASLDISGSFLATTADGIALGDQGSFSATKPEQSELLSVEPGALFFNQAIAQGGVINNAGNLTTGRSLALFADSLELAGKLQAGEDLTLSARDTVRIRDSSASPFIAAAGRDLLVQGDRTVDIFALNNANSGLFSGRDMVLRSTNSVGGDAHYWSDGNFRIEQLNGSAGSLFSPFDPIIAASGDVSFGSYEGASLHILAGGSVTVSGDIIITGVGTSGGTINPAVRPVLANVTLSNGTSLTIDGSAQPTLDIRAGVDWSSLGGLSRDVVIGGTAPQEIFGAAATGSNISIGGIEFRVPNGVVLLSNQFSPDRSLPNGDIRVGAIRADDTFGNFTGNSGSITSDSRNNTTVTEFINTTSQTGDAGNITLLSKNEVLLPEGVLVNSNTAGGGRAGSILIDTNALTILDGASIRAGSLAQGNGGSINISTRLLSLQNGGQINAVTVGQGTAGTIDIIATEEVQLIGTSPSGVPSAIGASSQGATPAGNIDRRIQLGDGNNIFIQTGSLTLRDGALIATSAVGLGGIRKAGDLIIDADRVELIGANTGLYATGRVLGEAGNISIRSNNLRIRDGAQVQTNIEGAFVATFGNLGGRGPVTIIEGVEFKPPVIQLEGKAGKITVTASNVELAGTDSAILADSNLGGSAGEIAITTDKLNVRNGAKIRASTNLSGQSQATENVTILTPTGQAGTITINAADSVAMAGRDSALTVQTAGNAGQTGNLNITTGLLTVADNAEITVSSRSDSRGSSGNLNIDAAGVVIDQGRLTAETLFGSGGDVVINVSDGLRLVRGGQISALTQDGQGGKLSINDGRIAVSSIELSGNSLITTEATGTGSAGGLTINARQLNLEDSTISTSTQTGRRTGVEVSPPSSDSFDQIENFSRLFPGLDLSQLMQGRVPTPTRDSQGDTTSVTVGNITGRGEAGSLVINARQLNVNNSTISASTRSGVSNGIQLNDLDSVQLNSGQILTSTASGRGGNINVRAANLELANRSQINAQSEERGFAGNVSLSISDRLQLANSSITTEALQSSGGNISINTSQGSGLTLLKDGGNITTRSLIDGGNIAIGGTGVIAFSGSRIVADAGQNGGNITFVPSAVFIEGGYRAPGSAEINSPLVTISATGSRPGVITVPDITTVENSLSDLQQTAIDPDTLIANSCIARTEQGGTFLVTGAEGLRDRPGDPFTSSYPLGNVRSLPETAAPAPQSSNPQHRSWQLGDPIVEPQGVYRLSNGRLIMSRGCL